MKMKSVYLKSILLLFTATLLLSCNNDDDNNVVPVGPMPTGNEIVYDLSSVSDPAISGTATVIEIDDNSITVELDLDNTAAGGSHPAHIHINTAVEGGAIAITLGTVDGATGLSTINFSARDDGTPITYTQLLDFDGYINVHKSATELEVIVAQGDIGQNELTGDSKVYELLEKDVPGISGTATFEKRKNGEALATLELDNTVDGDEHPAHIHENTAIEGGGIIFTFNPVNGTTGISKTNVSDLDDDTAFGYDDVLEVNGYINVHQSTDDLDTIIAQGDIGGNELSGESKVYELLEKDVPGISGTATLEERLNGTTLVTLMLEGTPPGGLHPAHIHENDAATGGDIVRTFNPVDGTTGISITQVGSLDDEAPITYTDLLEFDGYINVHLSATQLNVIVAQGNIGSNEGEQAVVNYDITNNGEVAYIFNGNGLVDVSNPTITLTRGRTYTFTVNAPGHPFYIKTIQGIGTVNPYNTGVTNNGASNGTVTFTVPEDAPDTLFYNCEFHAAMTNTITIID